MASFILSERRKLQLLISDVPLETRPINNVTGFKLITPKHMIGCTGGCVRLLMANPIWRFATTYGYNIESDQEWRRFTQLGHRFRQYKARLRNMWFCYIFWFLKKPIIHGIHFDIPLIWGYITLWFTIFLTAEGTIHVSTLRSACLTASHEPKRCGIE